MVDGSAPHRGFKHLLRNWLSWAGLVLGASALFAFLLLLVIDQVAGHRNPYVGILAYVAAPLFFISGSALALFGALLQWRRERHALVREEPLAIKIDLSRPRDRKILFIFAAAG